MDNFKDRYEELMERIEGAAARCGRRGEDIKIVAVTKTIPVERINKAVSAGFTDIGENRVQELLQKYEKLDKSAVCHMIGHLQTNKVRQIIGKAALIHSVDSIRLLDEIERRAEGDVNVLLQVNVSGEETKNGMSEGELPRAIERVEELSRVKVKGLMTIAPLYGGQSEARRVFARLNKLFLDIGGKKYNNSSMIFLSMGMSGDYEAAVLEGANLLRLGSAIFGERTAGL